LLTNSFKLLFNDFMVIGLIVRIIPENILKITLLLGILREDYPLLEEGFAK